LTYKGFLKKMETIKKEEEAVVIPPVEGGVDLEAELTKLREENVRLSTDRENYRKGMLKAKGKLQEEEDEVLPQPQLAETIEKIVSEKLLATQESQNLIKQEELVKKALKENRELKLALANRSNLDNSGSGSGGGDIPAVKENFLAPAQIQALKARGWDDKKIELFKKNMAKAV
jgi:hypothetical protein